MAKIRLAVSGIHYPLSMMSYFIRALQRRDDIELCTVGPFTGNYTPWMGGMHIPDKYVHTPNIPLPAQATAMQEFPFEAVKSKLPWKPDLWLEIDAGWHFLQRPDASVVAHIQTDPHCLSGFYDRHRGKVDYEFCMQTPYMKPGDIYLPYAYDPTVNYPMPEVEKKYQGCLVGLQYPQRTNLVNRLRARGMQVYYSTGEIYDEYRLRYNESEIALSWSSLLDLPCRVWEAMGMGLPLVANRVPDMANFFVDGEHYLGFDTVEEAEKQFMRLMADDDLRYEIGNNALRKVEKFHTWDVRCQTILETCKVL